MTILNKEVNKMLNKEYLEELNKDNREFADLEAEATFALCFALACGQFSN